MRAVGKLTTAEVLVSGTLVAKPAMPKPGASAHSRLKNRNHILHSVDN